METAAIGAFSLATAVAMVMHTVAVVMADVVMVVEVMTWMCFHAWWPDCCKLVDDHSEIVVTMCCDEAEIGVLVRVLCGCLSVT